MFELHSLLLAREGLQQAAFPGHLGAATVEVVHRRDRVLDEAGLLARRNWLHESICQRDGTTRANRDKDERHIVLCGECVLLSSWDSVDERLEERGSGLPGQIVIVLEVDLELSDVEVGVAVEAR